MKNIPKPPKPPEPMKPTVKEDDFSASFPSFSIRLEIPIVLIILPIIFLMMLIFS